MPFYSKSDIQQMEAKIESLEKERADLTAEIDDYRKTINGFVDIKAKYEKQETTLKNQYENKMLALKGQYENKVDTLNKSLESEKKSVNRKVNLALANIGVNTYAPEQIVEQDNQTPQTIYQTFLAMKEGPDKQAYFKANERTISSAIGIKNLAGVNQKQF